MSLEQMRDEFLNGTSTYKPVSIISGVTGVTDVTATDDGACIGNAKNIDGVTGVTSDELIGSINGMPFTDPRLRANKQPEITRPCYAVYDDKNKYGKAGVYYHGQKTSSKGEVTETDSYICDPLHIDAGSCDGSQNNFGLMLRFKNQRYQWRKWLMPLEMLSGSCEGLRAELLKQGLRIDHHKREMLPSYLLSQRPKKQLECALKVGWHGGVFVLPDRVIGNRDDIFFQTDHSVTADYGQRGTLEEWRQHISQYCMGNPLLLFQTSIAFTGALLKKCHVDYVGFHVFGDSSTGKSTGHKAAGSTWGGENFRRTWKATSNGLEAAAVLFNDGLLALDELGDSDAREVNQTIYALGNGTGKQRANVKGSARQVHKWRIALLSNGEKTLDSHFQEKGLTVKAGQEMRLLEVPVFGKYGAFDELHGMKDGRLFSDTLQNNSSKYYGSAGIAYLEKLVTDNRDFGELLEEAQTAFTKDDLQPQEKRAARAFALVAIAGELATEYGVTGWTPGAAIDAALECFKQWRNHRGTGSTEDRKILESIRNFIDRFGESRFTDKNISGTVTLSAGRAGYYEGCGDDRVYLFNPSGLKEAAGVGYDSRRINDALLKAGWITKDSNGKNSSLHKIVGKSSRFYAVTLGEFV